MGRSATRGPSGKRRSARKRREARYPSWTGSAAIAPPRFGEDTGRSPNRRLRRASASRGELGSLRMAARRVIKPGKAAPRRRASEVASVRGESRHDESRSLARGDFARARRPVSAMLRRGSAVRLSAQTGGVDSRPRPLQLQRRILGLGRLSKRSATGLSKRSAQRWLPLSTKACSKAGGRFCTGRSRSAIGERAPGRTLGG